MRSVIRRCCRCSNRDARIGDRRPLSDQRRGEWLTPPSLSAKAERSLRRRGVTPVPGSTVVDVDETGVTLAHADHATPRIPARTVRALIESMNGARFVHDTRNQLPGIVEQADVQSTSTKVQSSVQREGGPPRDRSSLTR